MIVGLLKGEGEIYGRQPEPGMPGSPNYEFWLAAAREVGLNLDGGRVDVSAIEKERVRMVGEMRMAPPGDKVWTWEHARAARLTTALSLHTPDTRDDLYLLARKILPDAVRATWVHVDGEVPTEEAVYLESVVPYIDSYAERLVNLASQAGELSS